MRTSKMISSILLLGVGMMSMGFPDISSTKNASQECLSKRDENNVKGQLMGCSGHTGPRYHSSSPVKDKPSEVSV